MRHSLLLLALISCSPKAPASTESKSAAKDVGMASPTAAEALPAPDPREKARTVPPVAQWEKQTLVTTFTPPYERGR